MGSIYKGRKIKNLKGDSNVKIARGFIIKLLIKKVKQRRLKIAKLNGNKLFN